MKKLNLQKEQDYLANKKTAVIFPDEFELNIIPIKGSLISAVAEVKEGADKQVILDILKEAQNKLNKLIKKVSKS